MRERDTHTNKSPIFQGEYYRAGEGGGLRMALKDRHCLITAEHDGRREKVNNLFRNSKPNQLDSSSLFVHV